MLELQIKLNLREYIIKSLPCRTLSIPSNTRQTSDTVGKTSANDHFDDFRSIFARFKAKNLYRRLEV